MKQFILGGARSGKSQYAEQLAKASGKSVIYIATATAGDGEMRLRIEHHQQQRPSHWQLIEEPLSLASVLLENDSESHCMLVDCLTLWLSNCMAAEDAAFVDQQQHSLLNTLVDLKSDVLLVSNEVGQGIVPVNKLARKFIDESGRLHQEIAKVCDRVVFITAGIAQVLK
jgi:adenosylcobinamide kinase / adenosylcobinamide-phosphate guanylyltransferase